MSNPNIDLATRQSRMSDALLPPTIAESGVPIVRKRNPIAAELERRSLAEPVPAELLRRIADV